MIVKLNINHLLSVQYDPQCCGSDRVEVETITRLAIVSQTRPTDLEMKSTDAKVMGRTTYIFRNFLAARNRKTLFRAAAGYNSTVVTLLGECLTLVVFKIEARAKLIAAFDCAAREI